MLGLDVVGVITTHPKISALIFLLISAVVLYALSGGRLRQTLAGLLRVFLTIFTTPFEFLRDALTIIRTARDSEQDYYRTRIFMLYRYSRLQYFALLFAALLVLCAGITASVLSLYPQAAIAQRAALAEEIEQVEKDIIDAKQEVSLAATPQRKAELQKARDDARKKHDQQRASNAAYAKKLTYSGPIFTSVSNADSSQEVRTILDGLDDYMESCPDGSSWSGFSATTCAEFRSALQELARRRGAELDQAEAATRAAEAFSNADLEGERAAGKLAYTEQRLADLTTTRNGIKLFDREMLKDKTAVASGFLVGALLLVIVIVWLGAILIDVLNWFILMMRAAEKYAVTQLPNAAREYEPSPRQEDAAP